MTMLRTCPMCDGSATARPWYFGVSGRVLEPHWVQCQQCKLATKLYDTSAEAAAAWNQRADPRETALRRFIENEGAP